MTERWASIIVKRLLAAGVGHFFISPGSRSTPLVLAILESGAEYTIHFDERGSAFAALGFSLQGDKIGAWVTTSGTALAHGFPAIIEASISRVPLVLLTADRPPELRNAGANQTVDQTKIYGGYVRHFLDLPAPTSDISESDLASLVGRASRYLRYPDPGPLHINCMFRKPLQPAETSVIQVASTEEVSSTRYSTPRYRASRAEQENFHSMILGSKRVLFLVGALDGSSTRAVAELAEAVGAVVFADARSGLRSGSPFCPNVVSYFDLILQSADDASLLRADCVVSFGERMTSKYAYEYADASDAQRIRVTNSAAIVDPSRNLSMEIVAEVKRFCRDSVKLFLDVPSTPDPQYLEYWKKNDVHVGEVLDSSTYLTESMTEPAVARSITKLLPAESWLHVASSMPIRDIDSFGLKRSKAHRITCSRGASGIDGTIATARGLQLGDERPITVLIGDLAALHDLNSLALAKSATTSFVIVVVNNDGGGIFSMLPISEHKKYFEQGFGTPHGLTFEGAASMFGCEYYRPASLSKFESAYLHATSNQSVSIIEVSTDRSENVDVHREIRSIVALQMTERGEN